MHRPFFAGILSAPLLLLFGLGTAEAQQRQDFQSGNYALKDCDARNPQRRQYVEGWCYGVIDALYYVSDVLPPRYNFCPPKGVTKEQGLRVVITYLYATPQRLHEHFGLLAMEALSSAWPCNQQPSAASR
jgi:hypothetical protein